MLVGIRRAYEAQAFHCLVKLSFEHDALLTFYEPELVGNEAFPSTFVDGGFESVSSIELLLSLFLRYHAFS